MVTQAERKEEEDGNAAKILILAQLEKSPRGISITGLVNECDISRMRVRVAIAYLLGAGKIEEEMVGMTKLYFLV
ncbi:hypothetical protein LCGC14_1805610 [marine sediment metagenome]|uniref:Helix-turn-helix type 11 domain-containing protein n=1 Tax=marine sediment metagenome TaxID=412755 RepID=A0A0F9GNF8_9ZZZZ